MCINLFYSQFLFFSVNVTDDGKKALMELAKGDMRKVCKSANSFCRSKLY